MLISLWVNACDCKSLDNQSPPARKHVTNAECCDNASAATADVSVSSTDAETVKLTAEADESGEVG